MLDEFKKRTYYYGNNPLLVIFDLPDCFQKISTLNSNYIIYKLLLKLYKYDECIQLLINQYSDVTNKLLYNQIIGLEFKKIIFSINLKKKLIFCVLNFKKYIMIYIILILHYQMKL